MWRRRPKGTGRPSEPHRAHRHGGGWAFPSTYRVKWDIEGDPKVSILIPNKDHTDDLEKCLYSIWSKTEWDNFEVIVIENNSTDPATFAYYKDAEKRYEGLKVVTWPEKGFNFSAINNFGRKAAQGSTCCC